MIKTGGGTNVTPAEVELALTNCDGVLEAYVVGASDGDRGTVVAAAVVPKGAAELDGDALKTQLRKHMSASKVPKFIWVTDKAQLPFTATGKIRTSDLADQLSGLLAKS